MFPKSSEGFDALSRMRQPFKPDALSLDVDLLNAVAPTSQPKSEHDCDSSIPAWGASKQFSESGDPLLLRMASHDKGAFHASLETHSTMCSEREVSVAEMRKSFHSTGPGVAGHMSPPNRLLHDRHEANMLEFAKELRRHPEKIQAQVSLSRRFDDLDAPVLTPKPLWKAWRLAEP
mmetsp:Transcript_9099/g.21829  ORF Transcript_9099/g.21829 Transcript_9099/m.21829 type:complete len:176 (-) Transcript_9099:194-721(-)